MRAHLVRQDDIHNGPVDYSTPIGETRVYRVDNLRDYLDRHKMPLKQTIDDTHRLWKILTAAGIDTEFLVHYAHLAPGKTSGEMYVQTVSF